MFGASKNPAARSESHLETIIGAESSLQGTIRSKGSVRIDGKIEGGVSAEGVIIGEAGEVQGDVSARTVVVGGKVTGNIHATESLELLTKSQVFGDLHAPQLLIAEGAIFEGSCLMASEKAKILEVNVS
ncbi:MAG: polymer-forming cytoskeletal protein [Elusimicrobiota bacterium]|jgi:cytoskeletal protein CcmA (bactofilin family)